MVFSSFSFLFYFLPLFFISYYFIDNKYKNLCLLLYSLSFYLFGCFDNIHYFFILIISIIINYKMAIYIKKYKSRKSQILFFTLFFDFFILFIFKYFDFCINIINKISNGIELNKLNLVLPIGISFWTFQIVSYVIDVYFEKIEPEYNIIDFATYVTMFMQLIAGPIVRFVDVMKEIKSERNFDKNNFFIGLKIFIFGLTSKVLLANQLSLVSVDINNFGIKNISTLSSWFYGMSISMQMYFDFFGYSLMAIGLGKMIGITITSNFNDPFLCKSVEEYWRCWHITLSTWFRDYLFYPLLMNKNIKNIRKMLNKIININISNIIINIICTFVVWFLTGLWHGANYNFIIWGLYFFIFLTIEQLFFNKFLKKHIVFSHIYLIIVIIISFIIFFNEDISTIILHIKSMFLINKKFVNDTFFIILKNNYKIFILSILTVLNVPKTIYNKINNNYIKIFVVVVLFLIDILFIHIGVNDPFLYFRF